MRKLFRLFAACMLLSSCVDDPIDDTADVDTVQTQESLLIICDEGNWQSDNGQLSIWDGRTGAITNQWFRSVNGMKLGDTPNDIIQVNDTLLAIAVNWSNIIQFTNTRGVALYATEDVPNNRRMATDGTYLYVTSYAHTVAGHAFTKGCVAKIDIATHRLIDAIEVGWEPEGIAYYDGNLFVANTGGYAFSESHDYESTVSVIDTRSFKLVNTIETHHVNLYGDAVVSGHYLCLNSAGDYYAEPSATVIIDMDTQTLAYTYPWPSTYATSDDRYFYTLGSDFSYLTGEYTTFTHTIDPLDGTISDIIYTPEVTAQINALQAPYSLYISPYTHNIYFTDATTYATAGYLYGYTDAGDPVVFAAKLYINPGHLLALK